MGKASRKRREGRAQPPATRQVSGAPVVIARTVAGDVMPTSRGTEAACRPAVAWPTRGAFGNAIRPETITALLIAKNEARFLDGCLRSLQGFADELIVGVDDRSSDGTLEIAQRVAPQVAARAEVFDFRWMDHFAEARNHGLRRAHGEWLLQIDADERLVCPLGVATAREHVVTTARRVPDAGAGVLVCRNVPDGREMDLLRLARNQPRLTFKGRIHEGLDAGGMKSTWVRLAPEVVGLAHLGYAPDVVESQGKRERNLRLLRLAVAEELADSPRLFYLGTELMRDGDAPGALAALERAWAAGRTTARQRRSTVYFMCADALARAFWQAGRFPECADHARELAGQYPQWSAAWCWLGVALRKLGRPGDALEAFEQARRYADTRLALVSHDPTTRPRATLGAAFAHADLRQYADAAALAAEAAADPAAPGAVRAEAETLAMEAAALATKAAQPDASGQLVSVTDMARRGGGWVR